MVNTAYKKINSLKKALIAKRYSADFVPDFSMYEPGIQGHKVHQFNLETIVSAINGKWVPDWKNTSQSKYYCWWWVVDKKKGGLAGRGLSLHDVCFVFVSASVAARLVFETEEQARFAAKIFLKYFELYYLCD